MQLSAHLRKQLRIQSHIASKSRRALVERGVTICRTHQCFFYVCFFTVHVSASMFLLYMLHIFIIVFSQVSENKIWEVLVRSSVQYDNKQWNHEFYCYHAKEIVCMLFRIFKLVCWTSSAELNTSNLFVILFFFIAVKPYYSKNLRQNCV